MNFSDLLQILKPCKISDSYVSDNSAPIFCSLVHTGVFEDGIPGTLHIMSAAKFPKNNINDRDVLNFVLIGKPSSAIIRNNPNANIIWLDSSVHKEDVFNLINKEFGSEMKMHSIMNDLSKALFKNRGLQSILDNAFDAIKNPIFVMDAGASLLAKSFGNYIPEAGSKLYNIYSKSEFDNSANEYSEYFNNIYSKVIAADDFYRFHNDLFDCEQMIACIRVREVEVGSIVVSNTIHPFNRLDELVFSRLASLISQEMQKSTIYKKNAVNMKIQFLMNIISSQNLHPQTVDRMQRIMNVSLNGRIHYLVVIEQQNFTADSSSFFFETIASQLSVLLTKHIYLVNDTNLTVLFSFNDLNSFQNSILPELKKTAMSNKLIVGISNDFNDLCKTYEHFNQAKNAIAEGRKLRAGSIFHFSDISTTLMLDIIKNDNDLLSFCVPELVRLLESDDNTDMELMTTLFLYLENFGNVAKTSSQLFIHRNTLLYRMNKIKSILNNELEDGEYLFHLMMSFRILRNLLLFNVPEE